MNIARNPWFLNLGISLFNFSLGIHLLTATATYISLTITEDG
jgi:hypothetical protein